MTGAVRSSGRIANDEDWFEKGRSPTGNARIKGINSPLIINGDFAMLAPLAFRPSTGELLRGGKDYAIMQYQSQVMYQTPVPPPGRSGLIYRGKDGSGRTGPYMFYGGIGGRLIAYRKDDFVVTQGGRPSARGGGGGNVGRWKKLPPDAGQSMEGKHFALQSDPVWEVKGVIGERDTATALAVAGDTVLTAIPRKSRGPLMARYRYADGTPVGETELPSWPVFGGIAVSKGSAYVAGSDGVVRAFR